MKKGQSLARFEPTLPLLRGVCTTAVLGSTAPPAEKWALRYNFDVVLVNSCCKNITGCKDPNWLTTFLKRQKLNIH